ncbi:MAG: hypothetical protein R3345_06730 [Fulvivirga sp.]|nr:hypothetical protein [Fulvivirga sp.]
MKALLWVTLIALILLSMVWVVKDSIHNWLFPTVIMVQTFEEANPEHIRIDWTAEGKTDTVTVFQKRSQVVDEIRSAGHNYFIIYYNDTLLDTFRHFQKSPEASHIYNFMIRRKRDSVSVDLKVEGVDAGL